MFIGKTIFLTKINNQDFLFNFEEEIIFILILVGVFMVWGLTRYLILQNLKAKANDSTHFNFLTLIRVLIQTIIFLSIGTCPATLLDSTAGAGLKTSYLFSVERHPYFWSSESGESIYVMLEDESLNGESNRISENDLTHEDFKATKVRNGVILSKASPTCESKVDEFAPECLTRGLLYENQIVTLYGQENKLNSVNHTFIPVSVEGVTVQPVTPWVEPSSDSDLSMNERETALKESQGCSKRKGDSGKKKLDAGINKPEWIDRGIAFVLILTCSLTAYTFLGIVINYPINYPIF